MQLLWNMYGFSIPIGSKSEPALKKTELALRAIKEYLGIDGVIQDFDYYFNLYNNMPFAGFLPNDYDALKVAIDSINSNGKLPNYTESSRPLPKPPKPKEIEFSSTIIHSDGTTSTIIHHKPKSNSKEYYDEQKRAIDEAEREIFKNFK